MNDMTIVATPAGIDAVWLTRALRAAGVLHTATVTGVQAKPIGNGMLGESVRFNLSYDHQEAAAPLAVVGKFPATDPTSKTTGTEFGLYLSELRFYQELAGTLRIRTPRALVAEIDPVTCDFTLLMEDLSPARPGNQLAGCSIDDCVVAMREAAAMHGPRWKDPALENMAWLQAREAVNARVIAALPAVTTAYLEQFGGLLEPRYVAVVERFVKLYGRILTDRSAPRTVQHGDFRLDNILFDIHGVAGSMATMDWQTVSIGPGLVDVAFFIGSSLSPDERRAHENDLMRLYFDNLRQHGVQDYSWNDCWQDYRRFAFQGLFTAVFSSINVQRTARGDEMFLTMARNHCQQLIDLDSFSFWK